jgi:Domain of unknown function (DUF4252)
VKRSVVPFVLFLSLSSLFAGCAGTPSVDTVGWEIQRRFPEARFEREEHFHLGRVKMGLLRGLVRMVPGKVEGQEILSRIHGVEVATYRVHSLPDLDRLTSDTRFEKQLSQSGWTPMVRTREEDERSWVFVRTGQDGALRNLFVVSLEADELSLVRVDGRIDQVLAKAIADEPKKAVATMKGEDEDQDGSEDEERSEEPAGL